MGQRTEGKAGRAREEKITGSWEEGKGRSALRGRETRKGMDTRKVQ